MRRDNYCRILRDVTSRFLLTVLDKEGSETTQEDILFSDLSVTHLLHESFYNSQNSCSLHTRFAGNLLYNISFSHFLSV